MVHFEIAGKDQKLLDAFYKGVFGSLLTPVTDMYSMVAKEEDGIGAFTDAPNYVSFCIEVRGFEATMASIESHGGKKPFGPHPVPDGTSVIGMFTDPERPTIGLIKRTPKR